MRTIPALASDVMYLLTSTILDGKLKIVNEKQTWHQIKTVALTAAVAFEHFEAFFCICPQLCGGQ